MHNEKSKDLKTRSKTPHLCKTCGIKKTIENSYKHNSSDFQTLCKKCHQERQKKRCKEDPLAFKRTRLKYRYDMSLEEWNLLLEAQKGGCKICMRAFGSNSQDAHVDHDHETGKIRGILCRQCNLLLGHYEKIVRKNYIEQFMNYLKDAA